MDGWTTYISPISIEQAAGATFALEMLSDMFLTRIEVEQIDVTQTSKSISQRQLVMTTVN